MQSYLLVALLFSILFTVLNQAAKTPSAKNAEEETDEYGDKNEQLPQQQQEQQQRVLRTAQFETDYGEKIGDQSAPKYYQKAPQTPQTLQKRSIANYNHEKRSIGEFYLDPIELFPIFARRRRRTVGPHQPQSFPATQQQFFAGNSFGVAQQHQPQQQQPVQQFLPNNFAAQQQQQPIQQQQQFVAQSNVQQHFPAQQQQLPMMNFCNKQCEGSMGKNFSSPQMCATKCNECFVQRCNKYCNQQQEPQQQDCMQCAQKCLQPYFEQPNQPAFSFCNKPCYGPMGKAFPSPMACEQKCVGCFTSSCQQQFQCDGRLALKPQECEKCAQSCVEQLQQQQQMVLFEQNSLSGQYTQLNIPSVCAEKCAQNSKNPGFCQMQCTMCYSNQCMQHAEYQCLSQPISFQCQNCSFKCAEQSYAVMSVKQVPFCVQRCSKSNKVPSICIQKCVECFNQNCAQCGGIQTPSQPKNKQCEACAFNCIKSFF